MVIVRSFPPRDTLCETTMYSLSPAALDASFTVLSPLMRKNTVPLMFVNRGLGASYRAGPIFPRALRTAQRSSTCIRIGALERKLGVARSAPMEVATVAYSSEANTRASCRLAGVSCDSPKPCSRTNLLRTVS